MYRSSLRIGTCWVLIVLTLTFYPLSRSPYRLVLPFAVGDCTWLIQETFSIVIFFLYLMTWSQQNSHLWSLLTDGVTKIRFPEDLPFVWTLPLLTTHITNILVYFCRIIIALKFVTYVYLDFLPHSFARTFTCRSLYSGKIYLENEHLTPKANYMWYQDKSCAYM
jgi:hypothetical protein